jgi:WD40 repeat protein
VRHTPPTRHPRRGGGKGRALIAGAGIVVLAGVIAAATLISSPGHSRPARDTAKRGMSAATVTVPRHYGFLTAVPLPQGTQEGLISSVAFSPDGKTLAIGYNNGSTYLWDVPQHRMLATLTGPILADWPKYLLTAVAFSPDGKTLAVANNAGSTALWNVASRQIIATLTNPAPYRISVAFSPDGKTLLTTGGDTVYQWDVASGRLLGTLIAPSSQGIETAAYSPDGTIIAAGDTHSHVYLWDAASPQLIGTLTEPDDLGTGGAVFSPDGKTLAITDGDGHGDIFLYNVPGQRLSDTFTEPLDSGGNGWAALALSPDGGTLASIGSAVDMWNMTTGYPELVTSIPSYRGGGILAVAFSPDGKTVAVGQNNATVTLWRAGLDDGSWSGWTGTTGR